MHIGEWKREIILTPKEEPIPQPVRVPGPERRQPAPVPERRQPAPVPERRQPTPAPERRREKEPATP